MGGYSKSTLQNKMYHTGWTSILGLILMIDKNPRAERRNVIFLMRHLDISCFTAGITRQVAMLVKPSSCKRKNVTETYNVIGGESNINTVFLFIDSSPSTHRTYCAWAAPNGRARSTAQAFHCHNNAFIIKVQYCGAV